MQNVSKKTSINIKQGGNGRIPNVNLRSTKLNDIKDEYIQDRVVI